MPLRRLKLEKKVPTGEHIKGAFVVRDHFGTVSSPHRGNLWADATRDATAGLSNACLHRPRVRSSQLDRSSARWRLCDADVSRRDSRRFLSALIRPALSLALASVSRASASFI